MDLIVSPNNVLTTPDQAREVEREMREQEQAAMLRDVQVGGVSRAHLLIRSAVEG